MSVVSEPTCDVCGTAGSLRWGGWMKTLCDECDAEREAAG